ncbi:MAG: hypothetical protein ABI693_26310 [Bryobacteraceae bacterium]
MLIDRTVRKWVWTAIVVDGKIQYMLRMLYFCLLAVGGAALGYAQCSIDPAKNFFQNFDNSCYAIPFNSSSGSQLAGDTNARYDLIYFHVNPAYELIVYNTFPQARYFSVTVNDDHDAASSSVADKNVQPLTSSEHNPFVPGTVYTPNQRYAVTVSLGGTQPPPGNILSGCSLSGYNTQGNLLNGYSRHSGINWNGDPNLPKNFPAHIGTPPVAGSIMARRYVEVVGQASKLLVRDLKTGCAISASDAINKYQMITTDPNVYSKWKDTNQVQSHFKYANSIQPRLCYGVVADNALLWERNPEYIAGINPDAAYLATDVPSDVKRQISGLLSSKVLRIRLRLPVLPAMPCTGCSLSGQEQLRYWSMSFQDGAKTIISLKDADVVKDASGFATIIVSIGGKQPANATAANGYTYFDLGTFLTSSLSSINIRSIMPTSGFSCVANRIPFLTTEDNPQGGYMGEYAPTADVVDGKSLPGHADPYLQPDSCSVTPTAATQSCTVFYPTGPLGGLGGLLGSIW